MPNNGSDYMDHPAVVSMLFHPRRDPPGHGDPGPDRVVAVPAGDGLELSVRCHLSESEGPHVLLFHGNGELASDYDDLAPAFQDIRCSLLACDYRGYGPNGGTPLGSNLLSDAVDTFDAVRGWMAENGRSAPLYVMGRSLGTAAALEIASRRQDEMAGVLLDSAFADTVPLLLRLGVAVEQLGLSEEHGFHNREKISRFYKAVLFMHGQLDTITPLDEVLELHADCPAKKRHLMVIPGAGHNDTFLRGGDFYFETIRTFMGHMRPRRRQGRGRRA